MINQYNYGHFDTTKNNTWANNRLQPMLLAILGLHDTLEHVKWKGGHKYYIKRGYFCDEVNDRGDTYRTSLSKVRKDLSKDE